MGNDVRLFYLLFYFTTNRNEHIFLYYSYILSEIHTRWILWMNCLHRILTHEFYKYFSWEFIRICLGIYIHFSNISTMVWWYDCLCCGCVWVSPRKLMCFQRKLFVPAGSYLYDTNAEEPWSHMCVKCKCREEIHKSSFYFCYCWLSLWSENDQSHGKMTAWFHSNVFNMKFHYC